MPAKKPFLLSKAKLVFGREMGEGAHGVVTAVKATQGKKTKKLVKKRASISPLTTQGKFNHPVYRWSRLLHLFKANCLPVPDFIRADIRENKKGLYLTDLSQGGKYSVCRFWGNLGYDLANFNLAKKIIRDTAIMHRLGYCSPFFDAWLVIKKRKKLERKIVDVGAIIEFNEEKPAPYKHFYINPFFIANTIKDFVADFKTKDRIKLMKYYIAANPKSKVSRELEKIIQVMQWQLK